MADDFSTQPAPDPTFSNVAQATISTSLPATMTDTQFTPDEQAALAVPSSPIPMTDPGIVNGQAIGPVLSDTAQQTYSKAMAYGIPGLGLGLIDTLGQSLGVFSDDTVQNALNRVSPQGLGDFYTRNKTALRIGGEVAGIFLPGMAASKVLSSVRYAREAGVFGEAIANSSAVDALLGSSVKLTQLEQKVSDAADAASKKFGLFSGKSFDGDTDLTAAKQAFYTGKIIDSARNTAAFEASYRLLYNNSEIMMPADYTLSDQLKWGGAFGIASAAADMVVGRYAVRRLIQGAANAAENLEAGPLASKASELVFRPGTRGIGITQAAATKSEIQAYADQAPNPTLATNVASDQTILDGILTKQLQNMAQDGHPIISRTTLDPDQLRLGLDALKKDETTFLYATKLGDVPDDKQDFYKSITNLQASTAKKYEIAQNEFSSVGTKANVPQSTKDSVLTSLRSDRRDAELASEEQHYVIENNGDWTVFGNRPANYLDDNNFKSIQRTAYDDTILRPTPTDAIGTPVKVRRSFLTAPDLNFKLHDDMTLEIGKTAGPDEWSGAFAAASKAIQNYRPIEGQKFILSDQDPWFKIEGTLALAKQNPDVAQNIVYAGKLQNQSDAEFNVVDQKYQQFSKMMDRTEKKPSFGASILQSAGTYSPEEVTQMLNLPQPIGMQAHPLIQTFAQARLQGMKTLDEMFLPAERDLTTPNRGLDMLQQNMRETTDNLDPKITYDISGGLFSQNDIRPVFVAAKTIPVLSRSEQVIHSLIEANRDNVISRLGQLNPQTAPLVSKVIQSSVNLAATNEARNVQSLNDGVTSGRGILTAQDRIANQEPTLKAAMLLTQNSEKIVEAHLGGAGKDGPPGIFDIAGLPTKVGQILKQSNSPQLIDFNRGAHAYRFGWDINKMIPNGDGSASFILNENSPINQRLFERFFPDMEEDADKTMMPDMSIASRQRGFYPLKISTNSGDLLNTISDLSKGSGYENNAVKWSMGLPAIKIRDFHLPTPALGNDGAWFVKNSADKVVATYSGPINSDNRKLAEKAVQSFSTPTDPHLAVSIDEVRRQHNIFDDDAFFNLIDYTDQLAKDGSGIQGGLAKAQIDTGPETLKSMIKSLSAQYMNVGTRARALLFEPQLNFAKQASQVTGLSEHFKEMNIYDRYISTIYNTSPRSPEGGLTKAYNAVENLADGALSFAYAHATELSATNDVDKSNARNLKNLINKNTSDNIYKQYQQTMPKWSPFEDTAQWLESTYNQTAPKDVRQIMATVAKVSSTMSLRFLDAGTAILNLASVMTNAPGVLAALRPMAGEDAAAHAARTASWGIQWKPGISTFSAMKAMATTTKAMFDGSLAGPMKQAADLGMFETEYASLAKIFGETAQGKQGQFGNFVQKASMLADSSERMSRMISWGMGYKIAKDLGQFDDEKNAFIFANNFANDMIGNYSPKNKPIMFQGALGLPLGAFQTYMFNYYRQIFSYVERKDYRALAATYAAQASMFGAKSVPGFGAFNNAVLSNNNTGDTIDNRLHNKLSDTAYELLMHGSLSSIPAIFGEGGLAFYTRGSVDMTQLPPTPMDLQRSPPFQFLTNTATGISRTIDNVLGAGGFSLQQQEEILANFSTNRAVKNIMEMAANAKTDQQGNVVALGTRDAIHVGTLLLGSQPTRIQNITEAYSGQRQVELNQQALRAKLNDHTRALMRGGEFDVGDLQDLVHDYTNSGGNPAYFGEWLRNTMQTSVTPKSETKMKEIMGSKRGIEFMNMLTAIQQQ